LIRRDFVTRLSASLAILSFGLASCQPAGPTTASAPAPSTGNVQQPIKTEKVTLRVDWFDSSYHSPFFLGIEKGWYKEAGFDLEITEGKGSGNVAQLVGNKTDTFGFAGADAVLKSVQTGIPVINVANLMPKDANAIFALKKTGVTKATDLKGKIIATTVGGTSDILLPAFLKGAGMTDKDVTIVPVDAAIKVQTVLQGKADAMNAPAWSFSYFTDAGGANSFLYFDFGVQTVGYGIIVNTDTWKSNPDMVKRFVAATIKSWEYAKDHQEESLAALEKASAENAKADVKVRNRLDFPEAMKLVTPAVSGKGLGMQDEQAWDTMQKQLLEYGVIKESRPVSTYFTNDAVPAK
jgi:NitT/TauT family transport system substrate-binding protein